MDKPQNSIRFWNNDFDLKLFIDDEILINKYIELSEQWDKIVKKYLFIRNIQKQILKENIIKISDIEKYNMLIQEQFVSIYKTQSKLLLNNKTVIKVHKLLNQSLKKYKQISNIAKNKGLSIDEKARLIININ